MAGWPGLDLTSQEEPLESGLVQDALAEDLWAVRGEQHVGLGPSRSRSQKPEECAELTEVLTFAQLVERQFVAAGQHPHDVDHTRLDGVDEVGAIALFEDALARGEPHFVRRGVTVICVRRHVDDPVGDRHEPRVVGGHHDHPTLVAQLLQQPDHCLGLDEVEVGSWLVGKQERTFEGPCRAGRRDILITSAMGGVLQVGSGASSDRSDSPSVTTFTDAGKEDEVTRLLTGLAVVVAISAPMTIADAAVKPVEPPPRTLASQHAVSGDEQVVSEFPIDFLGVFYDGDVEGGAVRFRRDGRWGPWVELHEDGVEVAGRWASGLVPAGDADAYQVRVPGGARAARAVAINTTDGSPQPAAATVSGCPDATAVVTRCEWGADESLMTWAPEFYPTQKLTVHHTATANGDVDPAATVRAIYRYQAVDRGFGDIGYQYLIDEGGRVYEGRYSGPDSYPAHDASGVNVVTAAHIGGFNSGNTGIALLGTLTEVDPAPAARGALENLLGELSARHSLDPHGTSQYVNPVSGVTKMVANISGHRDWAATECPGGTLYAKLPAIRDAAAGSPPPADSTAPIISGVTASTKSTSATVRWTTDEASTSQVEYRVVGKTDWTASTFDGKLTTSHTMTITNLARRTTYEYRVTSKDAAGNLTTSAIRLLTTK